METMTKHDTKKLPVTNGLADELASMPGIPGKQLTFTLPREPDLPFSGWNGGRNKVGATERLSITWLFKVQMYRVVEKALDPKQSDAIAYVPQSWAAFLPLD